MAALFFSVFVWISRWILCFSLFLSEFQYGCSVSLSVLREFQYVYSDSPSVLSEFQYGYSAFLSVFFWISIWILCFSLCFVWTTRWLLCFSLFLSEFQDGYSVFVWISRWLLYFSLLLCASQNGNSVSLCFFFHNLKMAALFLSEYQDVCSVIRIKVRSFIEMSWFSETGTTTMRTTRKWEG